jgi:hypothetical protein
VKVETEDMRSNTHILRYAAARLTERTGRHY